MNIRFAAAAFFITAVTFSCRNKKTSSPGDDMNMEGDWKVTAYSFGPNNVIEGTNNKETYYSYACSRSFPYNYQAKANWSIRFNADKTVIKTREDILTYVDTPATESKCAIQYKTETRRKTFSGTWKFSDDGKNLMMNMYTPPGGTGISVNSGPPMNYYNYEIKKLENGSLQLKELTSTEELIIARL